MKYIKYFESTTNLKIGDYVICAEHSGADDYKALIEFEIRNIGKVVDFRTNNNMNNEFDGIAAEYNTFVQYDNIPDEIYDDFNYHKDIEYCRIFAKDEIKHSSENKEDLIPFISVIKYNI
jgi:hypothetical protein